MEHINEDNLVTSMERSDSNIEIDPTQDQSAIKVGVDMENEENDDDEVKLNDEALFTKQTLPESGSEEEAGDIIISFRKKTNRIVDSDEENDDVQLHHVGDETSTIKAVLDSGNKETDLVEEETDLKSNIDTATTFQRKDHKSVPIKKVSTLIDSDSDEEPSPKAQETVQSLENKIPFNGLIDSDSEEDEEKQANSFTGNGSKVSTDLITSQLNSEQSGEEAFKEHDENQEKEKPKVMRASAKKALNDMQAIQSEQQRLHREAHISIPYHKPKRYTLEEFLTRPTIQKPKVTDVGKPLKMTTEELEEYAKLMEERAKEAAEFFKSESDDDEPTHNNADDHESSNNQQNVVVFEDSPHPPPSDLNAELEVHKSDEITDEINIEGKLSLECVSNEVEETVEILTSQPVITEVLELPKLDIISLSPAPPTTAEKVIRLIKEKQLPDSPSLKGDPNMMIDLETGDLVPKKSTGVDNLFKRFMAAKAQRKPKTTETLSILSTENGKLEIANINIDITEDSPVPTKDPKPREAYFKLKENLRSIISKKRMEELEKKLSEQRDEEEEYNKCLGEEEFEDESDFDTQFDNVVIDDEENVMYDKENMDNEMEESLENNTDEEGDTESLGLETTNHKKPLDMNEETNTELKLGANDCDDNLNDDDSDDDEESADEDSDDDDDDAESKSDFKTLDTKKKNRIIKAFQDDSDEETDFLRTPVDAECRGTVKLFDEEQTNPNPSEELLNLCSGKFEETQQTSADKFISQIPITQANINSQADQNDELLALCSGTFAAPTQTPLNEAQLAADDSQSHGLPISPQCTKQIFSSEEEENERLHSPNKEETPRRVKKLTKRVKKHKVKLGFSDDEDSEDEGANAATKENAKSNNTEDKSDDEENEVPETFVDYDSEENEIVVQMTKEDCVKEAENFFEKEAELSESEWGSADEDEKNLDQYDIELGDEDEFDRAKLQAELGKIHARKMLDEDIREVRLIQEMFFEDEENDGVGRQRQFKWKNMESGFSLNDQNGDAEHGQDGSEDEENEQLWRKIRYERDQLLREQQPAKEHLSISSILNSTVSTSIMSNSPRLQATTSSIKKLNIITAKTSTSVEAKKPSFLIQKNTIDDKRAMRGSFLERDKETLMKLVGLTKDADGTAGLISIKEVKPQNFVFATLTKEEHENLKRKSGDLLNSSGENGISFVKKSKLEPRRSKCLIDQLL